MNKNNEKDYENLKEIVDLCKEELEKNDENTTAILDIADLRSLNNILSEYKRLQNELDKLQKKYETDTHILQDQLDLANAKRVEVEKENLAQKAVIYEDCIQKQKIKDKIEELENANWYCESVKNQTIRVLKELLEESEEK